ncbi:MAG: hypothetical protein NUV63_09295 [Gallionella sp.]|nr:hypothetical protein [Gallionella sp.]
MNSLFRDVPAIILGALKGLTLMFLFGMFLFGTNLANAASVSVSPFYGAPYTIPDYYAGSPQGNTVDGVLNTWWDLYKRYWVVSPFGWRNCGLNLSYTCNGASAGIFAYFSVTGNCSGSNGVFGTMQCPSNATLSGSTCNCNTDYVPDPTATSCIPEQLTISLTGLGGEVMPTKTRAAYAHVAKSDGSDKSGAEVVLTLDVIPELEGQLPVTYTGTLSTYSGATGADGRLNFVFTAPVAGGEHIITAGCVGCTNVAQDTIKVPGCSVDDLPPITDPEVQLFEDNPDRSDETRLTDRMKTALACLKTAAAAGSPNVGSAYRPPAYNQHLIEVWEKWVNELKNNKEPACATLKTKIQGHFKTHKLLESQQPVEGSLHTLGEAVDVTISLPPATIDGFWPGCRLYRKPSLRIKDPVHFIYK